MGLLLESDTGVISWLCRPIAEKLFDVLDLIERIVMSLAGVSNGTVGGNNNTENIVESMLQSATVKKLMASLTIFGICVLILCVILAIVRNVYKEDSKVTISSIIGQAIKAVIGFILVPSLCLVGVMFSNVILQAIAGVTTGGNLGNSSSGGIYDACIVGERGSIFLDYTGNKTEENLDEIIKSFGKDPDVENEETRTSMEFATIIYAQYLYHVLTENYYWSYVYGNHDSDDTNLYVDSLQLRSIQEDCFRYTNITNNDGYADVLGIKTVTNFCRYATSSIMNNGSGRPENIDTAEDVSELYDVLYSQWRASFPNAVKTSPNGNYSASTIEDLLQEQTILGDFYPIIEIWCYNSGDYFGAPRAGFSYYYYGKCIYDPKVDMTETTESGLTVEERGSRLLKGAYNALVASERFESVDNGKKNNLRFEFQHDDNSLTNMQLRGSLGLGTGDINYFYAFMASVLICKSLFFLCFGLAKRIVQISIYYVLSPIALALYPFDNGKAFGSWKSDFIGYVVGAYGAVAGMNISIQLVGSVLNSVSIFNSGTLNSFTRLIMYIVLAQGIEQLVKLLSGWIGAKDLLAEGKATAQQTTEPIKRVAGKVAKVAGTVAGVATGAVIGKIGSNAAKTTLGNFKGLSAEDQEKEAQSAGFSSIGEYKSSLEGQVESGSFTGQIKSAGDKLWRGSVNRAVSTSFGQAFDKYSGLSGVIVQSEKDQAKQAKKSDLEAKFETDFKAGLYTGDLGKNIQAKMDTLNSTFGTAQNDLRDTVKRIAPEINKGWSQLQALGIGASEEKHVKHFLKTGDASGLGALNKDQMELVRAQREEYLRSAAYTNYQSSLSARDDLNKERKSYEFGGTGYTNMADAVKQIASNLDRNAFITAQKNGDEAGMKTAIESAMRSANLTGGKEAVPEIIKGIGAELQKGGEKMKQSIDKAGDKAGKKAESTYTPKAPKK